MTTSVGAWGMHKNNLSGVISAFAAGLLAVVLTWALTSNYYRMSAVSSRDATGSIKSSPNAAAVASALDGVDVQSSAALAGWVQAGIAALGLVGLALTVWFARNAWKATKDTADIAREMGKAQVRAYLSFHPGEVSLFTDGAPTFTNRLGISIAGRLLNTGQSPASRFWLEFQFLQLERRRGAVPADQLNLERFPAVAADVGAGQERDHIVQATMDIDLARLVAGNDQIQMIARVHYLDVFDDHQMSEIDAWIVGVGARCAFFNINRTAVNAPGLHLELAQHD